MATVTVPIAIVLVVGVALGCAGGLDRGPATPTCRRVEITTLSVGRGVPEATEAAYQQMLVVLDREGGFKEDRIGLEGETRARAEFSDKKRADAITAELAELASGIDLLTIEWSECSVEEEAL